MRRAVATVALLILVAGAGAVRADSFPVLSGVEHGIELCQQSVCGSAIFVGVFQGTVGNKPGAIGTIAVQVKHDPLPLPGHHAAITGGSWQFVSGFRLITGSVTGDLYAWNDKQFQVTVKLTLEHGGIGDVAFVGLLDHNNFPPTIDGIISQH
jgi:hypothetical protein